MKNRASGAIHSLTIRRVWRASAEPASPAPRRRLLLICIHAGLAPDFRLHAMVMTEDRDEAAAAAKPVECKAGCANLRMERPRPSASLEPASSERRSLVGDCPTRTPASAIWSIGTAP